MKRRVFGLVLALALAATAVSLVQAQGGAATATLAGIVRDSNGDPVPGAAVTATYDRTASVLTAETNKNGQFSFPSVSPGVWTLRVTATGFKTSVVTEVRPAAGLTTSIPIVLETGNATDVVTTRSVTAFAQAVSPQVTTTVTGEEMARLPLQSRNTLNFVQFLAGVDTPLNVRNTTVMGLPQSTLNITFDGINIQDNVNKTTDGFFATIRPALYGVDSLTMSLATPNANVTGQGAVQIQFITRSGTNQFAGGGYYAFRDEALGSNSYFNKQFGLPKNKAGLNDFGVNTGGPFGGKAFFFVNYSEIHDDTSVTRTRTILNPNALNGQFSYNVGSTVQTVNVLTVAGANGQLNTVDPTVSAFLASLQANTSVTGVTRANGTDPLTRLYSFQNPASGVTRQPIARVDLNLAPAHRLTGTYAWAHVTSDPDTLNNGDPTFPGIGNTATQSSNRQMAQGTLRSVLGPRMVNELRFGGAWSGSDFGDVGTSVQLPPPPSSFQLSFPLIDSPSVQSLRQRQKSNDWTIGDTFTWQLGKHAFDFGGGFSQFNVTLQQQEVVPVAQLGLTSLDPANAMFTTANFPGASTADLNNAGAYYALLTGRVASITTPYGFNGASQNVFGGTVTQQGRLNETGLFAQDTWRVGPRMTLTGGLRYEIQSPFTATNNSYATATLADICGVSGTAGGSFGRGCNFFAPGTVPGPAPQLRALSKGSGIYDTDMDNLAPNVGMVWRIGPEGGLFRKVFGDPAMSALHAGYAVSYSRQGLADFTSVLAGNSNLSPVVVRDTDSVGGPVLLRNPNQLGSCGLPPGDPNACAPAVRAYPFAVSGQNINIFDPSIQVPKTTSYSIGLQRSLGRDTSVDLRYVRTRFEDGWVTENWNELNIYESGFLNEFRMAQANLENNIALGRGATFAYFGPGSLTSPLPQYLAFFSGVPQSDAGNAALYTSASFTNAAFINRLALNAPDVAGALSDLWNDPTLRANAFGPAGLARNQFVVNPDANDANVTRSAGRSEYDAVQIDLRRRLAQGLQLTANYTYSWRWDAINDSIHFDYYLARSTDRIPHAFKTTWYYEIPFGRSRKAGTTLSPWVNGLIGDWNVSGTGRVQSGQLLRLGGVRLVGMTETELQREFKIRKASDGTVTTLPDDIILNTRRAFSPNALDFVTGYSSLGVPVGRYLAPGTTAGCIETLPGECGEPRYLTVTGPTFSRFDLGFSKAFSLGGRRSLNVELDIFNLLNKEYFVPVFEAGSSPTLNQVTGPFNNTSDQGARVVQLLGRVRW